MPDLFSTQLTVRGYECNAQGVVPLPRVLSFCEHCRWLWISQPDLGLETLLHEGHFFVVHKARVALYRTFGLGTSLTVRAGLRSAGRVHCEVEQDLVREDGVLLGRAWIHAIWIGPRGRMRRVPDITRQGITDAVMDSIVDAPPTAPTVWRGATDTPLHPTFAARVTDVDPPDHAVRSTFTVRPSDCDMFEHMNNAVYLRYVEDALEQPLLDADVEYRRQAVAGDDVTMHRWPVDDHLAVVLTRGEETLCRMAVTPRT